MSLNSAAVVGFCCFVISIHLRSGQSTRAPCAIEHDAFRRRGSNLSPDVYTYQRIISNNSYAHDDPGDNSEQEKEGSTVSSIDWDRC